MKSINTEELKTIQLDLFKKTTEFCEKNNLRYYLCDGTLIGAIRHKGYISWDDKIDISMPRLDCDKFIQSFNQECNHYQVIDMSNNNNYGFPFAKVHDTRTFLDELQYAKDEFGVNIVFFPIDGVKEDSQVNKIMHLRKILHTKKANYPQRKLSKKIINTFGKILLLPFSVHKILTYIDNEARKYQFGSTNRVGVIVNPYGVREIVEKSVFDSGVYQIFEGLKCMTPIDYESIYGDYMQLPPKERRFSHYVYKAYWK